MLNFRAWTYGLLSLLAILRISHAAVDGGISLVSFAINASTQCGVDVTCMGFAKNNTKGMLAFLAESEAFASGVALRHERIQLFDPSTEGVVSFRTNFTFAMSTERGPNTPGDGMTFALISNISWVNVPAKKNYSSDYHAYHSSSFGLFDPQGRAGNSVTVAVEFDTFNNAGDIDPHTNDKDSNHIGVDVNSIKSKNTTRVDGSFVSLGKKAKFGRIAWIDYDGLTNRLEVRVSKNDYEHKAEQRPNEADLTYDLDLSKVFLHEDWDGKVWVGFTASNGGGKSRYGVRKWAFDSCWGQCEQYQSAQNAEPALANETFEFRQQQKSEVNPTIVLSATIPTAVILCAIVVLWISRRRRSARTTAVHGLNFDLSQPGEFSYKELSVSTNGFCESSILGEGGFGTVYRGVLPSDGSPLAIKRLNDESRQGKQEFMTEIVTLTQFRHRNIVQLLGWCKHEGKLLLVYELMPNGSLDRALFTNSEDGNINVLTWSKRFRVIHGLASALEHLHEGGAKQVIHRDVKSSNVMLDSQWEARLGGFGLARMEDHLKIMTTTIAAGTHGYMSPEAAIYGKFTVKSDVYSFGIVVLEVACGRKALDTDLPEDESILVEWVWSCYRRGDLLSAADPRLEGAYKESEMTAVLLLGLLCSSADTHSRPSMRQVTQVLFGESPMLPAPICPSSDIVYLSDLPQTQFQALLTSNPLNYTVLMQIFSHNVACKGKEVSFGPFGQSDTGRGL